MSVWFVIPSKRPPAEAEPLLQLWLDRGYKLLIQRDPGDPLLTAPISAMCIERPYQGYAEAVNYLVGHVLAGDPQAEWIVTGGDDVEPDPHHAAETIAAQCSEMFGRIWMGDYAGPKDIPRLMWEVAGGHNLAQMQTFGVMQPTGDRWGEHDKILGKEGAYIDRVCGSPWMGREFCRRMYQGQGPLFSGYFHMFEDEELQNVAQRLGVLWQRRDLIQLHRHYGREGKLRPAFLDVAAGGAHWKVSEDIFKIRQMAGFPGHEPIL